MLHSSSLALSASSTSTSSSYGSSSLFEHTSSAGSHTDSSPPLPDSEEAKPAEVVRRVAYLPHPMAHRRPNHAAVLVEEDLGYDADPEQDMPSGGRPATRRRPSGQTRRTSGRKASNKDTPKHVGLGLGLPSEYSFSGGATIDASSPPKPRLMATVLSDSPSPIETLSATLDFSFLSPMEKLLQNMDTAFEITPDAKEYEMSPPSSTVLSSGAEVASGLGIAYHPSSSEQSDSFVDVALSPISNIPLVDAPPLDMPYPTCTSNSQSKRRSAPSTPRLRWRLFHSPSPRLVSRHRGRLESKDVTSVVDTLQGLSVVGE